MQDFERQFYELSQIFYKDKYEVINFGHLITMIQLPNIDIYEKTKEIFGRDLTETEKKVLDRRVHSAKYWIEHYAPEESKIKLQENLPESANNLTPEQRAFLRLFATYLDDNRNITGEEIQQAIFDIARLVPLNAKDAFKAIYTVLIDKQAGPKAGTFIAFIDRDFVVKRFNEVIYDKVECWRRTSFKYDEFSNWVKDNKENIEKSEITYEYSDSSQVGVINAIITMKDGKKYMKRIIFENIDKEEFSKKVDEVKNNI